MKILYTPLMIVPSVSPEQRAAILDAAGPGSTFVEAKDAATQRREIVDTDALFGRVSPEIFPLGKRLRYYQSIGAGVDSILTQELVESDVPLASEKGGVGIHLAEHAFALLLALTRGLHTAIRQPDYSLREPIRLRQLELYDLTMGIVGFGGTGREVAKRALGFGMRVLGVDIEDVAPEPGVEAIWKPDRLGDLLGASDAVVICLPLTKATHHLFTRDLFRKMKKTGYLINVTRGAIVYGDDLLKALDEETIGGAGLDVTDPEPLAANHRLWTHPRAIVTPHTAGGSPRRAQRVIDTFCENLRRMRAGKAAHRADRQAQRVLAEPESQRARRAGPGAGARLRRGGCVTHSPDSQRFALRAGRGGPTTPPRRSRALRHPPVSRRCAPPPGIDWPREDWPGEELDDF